MFRNLLVHYLVLYNKITEQYFNKEQRTLCPYIPLAAIQAKSMCDCSYLPLSSSVMR